MGTALDITQRGNSAAGTWDAEVNTAEGDGVGTSRTVMARLVSLQSNGPLTHCQGLCTPCGIATWAASLPTA